MRYRDLTAGVVLALAPAFACRSTGADDASLATYDAATFFETTSLRGASFSADEERILFTSDASGIFNAWSVPVAGGAPTQLTHSTTDAVYAVDFFPADDRFLYTADQGGNELNHLFVRTPGGKDVELTPGENLKASFAGWRDDDRAFFVLTNERDPRHFDLYRYQVAELESDKYPRELLYQNDEGFNIGEVSPDGRWAALAKVRNNADSDLYVLDLAKSGAQPLHVTPHEGDVLHQVMTFTTDSRQLYYSSNAESEFDRVWSYDLWSGQRRVVVADAWDVSFVYFSRHGRYRVKGVNADARTKVSIRDMKWRRPVALAALGDLPAGDLEGLRFSPSEQRMAFYLDSDTSPPNLYVLDFASGEHRRLTDSLNPAIDPAALVGAEVVRYPSFDGLEIPAILYRPRQATASHPAPALVWVHGGPGGQSRIGYNPTIQHLVNHGYAVLASTTAAARATARPSSPGRSQAWRRSTCSDCVAGQGAGSRSRAGSTPSASASSAAATAATWCSRRWPSSPRPSSVGVDIFGVTQLAADTREHPAVVGGLPRLALRRRWAIRRRDPERLRARTRRSSTPTKIEKPLLMVSGRQRPARAQGRERRDRRGRPKKNGVPVEYVVFADEGHGFRSKANRIAASEAFLRFANAHLKHAGENAP